MRAEEFLAEFAPNVVDRLDKLEDHAKRVEGLLFKDEEGRPSLETVTRRVNSHVTVLCDWARAARVVLRWVAIIGAAAGGLATLAHLVPGVL